MLEPTDITGGTFWLISAGTAATTVFLLLASFWVRPAWKPPLAAIGAAMLVSAIIYFRASEVWLDTGSAPIVFRYVDWLLTIPLQIIVFYLIAAAVGRVSIALFWRLLVASAVMILAGFMGDAGYMNPTLGFLIWLAGWLYILGELYMGQASEVVNRNGSDVTRAAFFWLRLIVTVGFAIHLLGYFIDNFAGGVDNGVLNAVYNLADLLNKITFGLIVYRAALRDASDHA